MLGSNNQALPDNTQEGATPSSLKSTTKPFKSALLVKLEAQQKERAELRRAMDSEIARVESMRLDERERQEEERSDREYDWRTFMNQTWNLLTPGIRIPLQRYEMLWNQFIAEQSAKGRDTKVLEWKKQDALTEYAETLKWYEKCDRREAEEEKRNSPEYLAYAIRREAEALIMDLVAAGVFYVRK